MCNFINTHTHTHTQHMQVFAEKHRKEQIYIYLVHYTVYYIHTIIHGEGQQVVGRVWMSSDLSTNQQLVGLGSEWLNFFTDCLVHGVHGVSLSSREEDRLLLCAKMSLTLTRYIKRILMSRYQQEVYCNTFLICRQTPLTVVVPRV